MKRFLACLAVALTPALAHADDIAGQFDYYVLSLSWSPSWCSQTGDRRGADQCRRGRGDDFIVHGLWPQYENGYPQDCRTNERDPSRRESQRMADIMGSGGLAWYQWQKHGRCSGLSAHSYYDTMRQASENIRIPDVFDDLDRDITLPPSVAEEAFLEANPELTRNGVTVTCQGNALQEIRICLNKDLSPRECGRDIRRDCTRPRILMEAVR